MIRQINGTEWKVQKQTQISNQYWDNWIGTWKKMKLDPYFILHWNKHQINQRYKYKT